MKIVAAIGIAGALAFVSSVSGQNSETGELAVYASQYQGRPTSSGELYDMNRLTAAHRTLPLGTTIRVANFDTGRMVDVRVNDRKGEDGRILNLSHAAAAQIGLAESRTAPGSLLVITPPSSPQVAVPQVSVPVAQPTEKKFQPLADLRQAIAEKKASASADTGIKKGLFGKPKTIYGIPASQYQPPAAQYPQYPNTGTQVAVANPQPGSVLQSSQPIVKNTTGNVIPLSAPARARVAAIPAPEVPITTPKPAAPQASVSTAPYRVQFGAFRRVANAQELSQMLAGAGIPTFVTQSHATGLNIVLTQGGFGSANEAQQWIDYEAARRRWTERPVVIR